jgi:hypothetical protein
MRLTELKVNTKQDALNAIKDMFRNETLVTDEGAEALLGVLCSFGLVMIDDESCVRFAGA